jgi:hypothetical protein
MRRVYILNKGEHDYSDALRFGEIVFLTEGELEKNNHGLTARITRQVIEDSYPDDYIMITGLASHISILTAGFAAKHGKINLLVYHPGKAKYVEKNYTFTREVQ